MTALTAQSFTNTSLVAYAGTSATLYQRTAYNQIGATASTATNIGNLVKDQSQLDVVGNVTGSNNADYYSLNLTGDSLKLAFQNVTNTTNLRVQIYDSTGTKVIADSNGNADQLIAYDQLTSGSGLAEKSGQYVVKVSYAPISLKSLPQSYSLQLYSGQHFQSAYQTTAVAQTDVKKATPVDNTQTYATSDAHVYGRDDYNTINSTPTTGVNIGWLAENRSQLSLTSQLTQADSTDYYGFTFQSGSAIKLAVNNQTNTSGLRVQLLDQTGTSILADSNGTAAQKAAYAELTSSSGLKAQTGAYVVKVSYAPGANKANAQTYNFQLSSGNSYSSSYATTASAQTIGNAMLSGTYGSSTPAQITASYLANQQSGGTTDILSVLASITTSTTA
jgi:hypothetical protein